jgi:hypothetical protein
MRRAHIFVGLLHYPMYNKNGDIITTSVTNLDVHDISRSARTYDVERFIIVHPSPRQQEMITLITDYWGEGYGLTYNADRHEALSRLVLCATLAEAQEHIFQLTGRHPQLVATDAKTYPQTLPYADLRSRLAEPGCYLLLFGTGWGMQRELVEACDYILPPIEGAGDYNHLSVRSAVAIILDRLLDAL